MKSLKIIGAQRSANAFILLLFCAAFTKAMAQDTTKFQQNSFQSASWSRFSLHAGGFISSNNSGVVLGSQQLGAGIQIDVEDALGLETSTLVFRVDADYRFGKRSKHSASFGYFDVRRNANKVLEKEIEIGDETFPIGTEVSSQFDLTIIRAKYGYSFFQDKRVSLGGTFGFYIMPLSFSVKALGLDEQSTHFVAPLPLLGFYTNFRITDKLYLNQSIEFLYLSISNFTGKITDFNFALEHRTFSHFGFGAGINLNGIDISVEDESSPLDFVGKINMEYSGLLLYGKYYF
ncbi:MAG: hypothetical protein KDC58_04870 [Cyclobacteriaceae bacterium]|nr:hypothetical protein [Cyclobacteriaceae bacterium]